MCARLLVSQIKIPVAPLKPIPPLSKPFEYLLIDCVWPLPHSMTGLYLTPRLAIHIYTLLSIYPLISSCIACYFYYYKKSVLKALPNFMLTFGIPKVIQTEMGLTFMSRQLPKVLQQLKISHNISSAYHPQSQGALERFHQTLKSLLGSHCLELGSDWE